MLRLDTDTNKFYRVTEAGGWSILPYDDYYVYGIGMIESEFYKINEHEYAASGERKDLTLINCIEVMLSEEPKSVLIKRDRNVMISQKRSLAAADQYSNRNVCVLNFASATNAGGGVTKGSNAQEEAICRCSTLYPCISDSRVVSQFHDRHRIDLKSDQMNALYNDDCIYTPKVAVFRDDTDTPTLLPEKLWYEVDVISCAAPNLRNKPRNAMNPDSGSKAVNVKPSELLELHKKRMSRILDIAKANGAEVVILGAFGCGAFQNSPDVVASAMKEIIKKYLYSFETIEFAVYCPPGDTKNYDVFRRTLWGGFLVKG